MREKRSEKRQEKINLRYYGIDILKILSAF